MPDDWIVVQVGPVCRIPNAARYWIKRRWWYVHQRSRLAGTATEREVDPWSASARPDWLEAQKIMHQRAARLQLPWRTMRDGHKCDKVVAYYLTREEAVRLKAFDTDRVELVEPVEWGEGGGNATRL